MINNILNTKEGLSLRIIKCSKVVFLLLFFSSCIKNKPDHISKKVLKQEFSYSNSLYLKKKIERKIPIANIYLDSLNTYSDLFLAIESIACKNKLPILEFENEKSKFNLTPIFSCSERMIISCYKSRNVIFINKDSIIINRNYKVEFDSIKSILGRHLLNEKKESIFSNSTNKAFIEFYQNPNTNIKITRKKLIRIANEFNELNKNNGDTLNLKIIFKDYGFINLAPIPNKID